MKTAHPKFSGVSVGGAVRASRSQSLRRRRARFAGTVCVALLVAGLAASRLLADDFLDRVEETLTASAFQAQLRARLSGTLDLEGYRFQGPAPALFDVKGDNLFAPRLVSFLDAQFGTHLYAFAQARADRGFDPANRDLRVRADEYALRVTPWTDARLHVQVGKFATIVGNWVPRHDSWTSPFVTAPLPYENLTGVWDFDIVHSSNQLLQWSHVRAGLPAAVTALEKARRLPVLWGPSYALGAAAFGSLGRVSYALEVKNAALSSRPEEWRDNTADRWAHPTVSGRLGFRPNEMWSLGWSASTGSYLRPFALPAAGHGRGDYREKMLASDAGFAWHHWQVWSEVFATRFTIPLIGDADTVAYYTEVKYKFTPQFFGALRWNQQLFASIPDRGSRATWGRDLWRLDVAPGYRFTPHTQLKLQYSLEHESGAARDYAQWVAVQLAVRF